MEVGDTVQILVAMVAIAIVGFFLAQLMREVERIWQSEKRTVVFVTNNIEEASYLADRIILLTNCPTLIEKEYIVDMPRPRSYVNESFLKLRKQITDDMEKSF